LNVTPDLLAHTVELVRAIARSTIMPRFRKLSADQVQMKSGPSDLVTIADEEAEVQMTHALTRLVPGCAVVGEEATTRDPASMAVLSTADLCFIVDPIDGTFNFAAGLPLFGVMVAVVEHGQTVAGIIHDPVGDDTAMALAGQGAWLRAADGSRSRLQVAAAAPISAMNGSLSWRYMAEPRRSRVCSRMPRLGGVWDYRCAAHQYRMLAAGHAHFSVYNRLLPWDHAAGVLLHQEAGGYTARLDGTPYTPLSEQGGLICAPDRATWLALRQTLFEDEAA